jgi:hypothetical protein
MVPFVAVSEEHGPGDQGRDAGQLPGAEQLFFQQFDRQFTAGQHQEAAETAARPAASSTRSVSSFILSSP